MAVSQFCLDRTEERFRICVIIAIPLAAHALNNPVGRKYCFESPACILAPPVGMEDKILARIPLHQGLKESTNCQIIGQPFTHGPPHNRPGEDIKNNSQIEPAFIRLDIGNIRYPDGIRSIDDFPGEEIRYDRSCMLRMGCNLVSFFHLRSYAVFPHEPGNSVFSTEYALRFQFPGYPRTSIGLSSQCVCFPDMIHQFVISLLSDTHGSSLPSVIGAP